MLIFLIMKQSKYGYLSDAYAKVGFLHTRKYQFLVWCMILNKLSLIPQSIPTV